MDAPEDPRPDQAVAEPFPYTAPPLSGPVIMNQDWLDLAWLHWAVDPARVAPLLPPGVRPDVLDGRTYVGLVPFRMVDAGFGRRGTVPWAGTFLETNVRLYSIGPDGRRGVVFLSLDTDRLPVVLGARVGLGVPYRWAAMSHQRTPASTGSPVGDVHEYAARLRRPHPAAGSRLRLRVGEPREPSELDHFVADRWRLHTRHLGLTLDVRNHHGDWPVHDAEVLELDDELMGSVGFGDLVSEPPDQVGFSPGVHTVFGLPRRPR